MKNIKILDCTLRDGGRIIDCAFSDNSIKEITDNLTKAKVDIIEVGFLRDRRNVNYNGNSTFFTDTEQITRFLPQYQNSTTFAAFIDFGMFDFSSLKQMDSSSITGIRVGFTKKDFDVSKEEVIACFKRVKELGYTLFIQGVNSLNYSDRELLDIVDMVNEIEPYSFGIVDTYGAMYVDDVTRIFNLIDHNLKKEIAIDFHSHNNFQLSFSFAQEIIRLSHGVREIIIDATLYGMGKGAGNLNTELITDYMVRKIAYDYDLDIIFDTIDEHFYDLHKDLQWGYSPTSLMSGIYKSHPNNVIYLTQKFRLNTKDIKNILSMLDEKDRQKYDYGKIDSLLQDYNYTNYDDNRELKLLSEAFNHNPILILAPGKTLSDRRDDILRYINTHCPIIISVNFVSEFENSYAFFANAKRYPPNSIPKGIQVIVTSDISGQLEGEITVNFHSLVNRGYKYYNNSSIMLLNLLRRINVSEIAVAGLDGFSEDESNYFNPEYEVQRLNPVLTEIDIELQEMLDSYIAMVSASCQVNFITPSMFDRSGDK
jgi:4-hydroxy 2-oxovalerate aldolase